MIIKLGTSYSVPNVVDKKPYWLATTDGQFRSGSSILNPVFIIDVDKTDLLNNELHSINYVYSEDFYRYYFVNEIEWVNNKLFALHCHVDVLKSYEPLIKKAQAIVQRNEYEYNLYLDDGLFRAYSNPNHKIMAFPNQMNDFSYILALSGNGE